MPISYEIDSVRRLVLATATGVLTDEDVLQHKQRLAKDPDFRPGMRELSDVRAIERLIDENFPLTPKGIIESLDLRRPIYRKTSSYGHFGSSDPDFTWESTARAGALREAAGLEMID